MFVKTETTVKKTVQSFQDGIGPEFVLISFEKIDQETYELVIGARYEKASACCLSKEGLFELIDQLNELRDTLNEEQNNA